MLIAVVVFRFFADFRGRRDDTRIMNQTIRIASVLFLCAASLGAQTANRWTLFQALDWSGRLDYLHDQTSVKDDGPFLLQALDLTDSSQVESGTDQDSSLKKEITLLLIKMLAAHPEPGAVAAISRIPQEYKDPLLKGESWVALAKLGDKAFIPGLVTTLDSLNESGLRSRNEEIQAAYAVQALGILKASEGFRAVAGASLAWYSPASQVKVAAKKTLPLLVSDFEKAVTPLLADDQDLTFREGFFQEVVEMSDSAMAARAASAVLSTLVYQRPGDKVDQDRTRRLTLAAFVAAQNSPHPPASLVPSLKVLLGRTESYEILAGSVRLLGRIDDPSAVALLSDTLAGFNLRQKAGTNTTQDLALVKELFQALAQTGKAEARVTLDEARFSDYPPGFVREAQAAEDKLPRG